MQRRNILIGMGSVAVGGMAAFGGNAFNVARADRGISVQTVGDDASYLTLVPTSAYAEYDDDTMLRLAFDGSTGSQNATGLAEDANFVFTDVFEIRNEGRDTIAITLSENLDDVDWSTNFPRAYYTYEEIGTTNDRSGDGEFTGDVDADGAVLDPGEGLLVHFEFVGREADDRRTDTAEPETVSIYAEAVDTDDD
ncbi:oxidoreductase [Halorubrum sp. DTA46]|uniref:oxidoreductase n=1 Tax=Halorubrum sp. DTA46 TaxID=3402162 RepID=UPI003AB0CCD5